MVLTALEARAEIENLDALHEQRRDLIGRMKRLKAVHGQFGLWDERRAALCRAIETELRAKARDAGERLTDEACKALAQSDPRYKSALDQALIEKTDLIEMENTLRELEERIRNRELCLSAYSAEARLR